jgi:hypothetical protein
MAVFVTAGELDLSQCLKGLSPCHRPAKTAWNFAIKSCYWTDKPHSAPRHESKEA